MKLTLLTLLPFASIFPTTLANPLPIDASEQAIAAPAAPAADAAEALAKYQVQCSGEAYNLCKDGAVIDGWRVSWDCNSPGTPSNWNSVSQLIRDMCSSCKCTEMMAVCAGAGNRKNC